MLNDASGFHKIYVANGYTDLRRGMEGLANIIRFRFHLDPYDRNTLFLFCGKRTDRIKGLLWEGDGFLLLYKRLDTGAFNWPRNSEEALSITPDQYAMLMQGLEIVARHPIEQTGTRRNFIKFCAFRRNFLWTGLSLRIYCLLFIHNGSVLYSIRLGRQGICG